MNDVGGEIMGKILNGIKTVVFFFVFEGFIDPISPIWTTILRQEELIEKRHKENKNMDDDDCAEDNYDDDDDG